MPGPPETELLGGSASFWATIPRMGRTPDAAVPRGEVIRARLTHAEAAEADRQRAYRGGMSRSAYVRYLIQQDGKRISREKGAS